MDTSLTTVKVLKETRKLAKTLAAHCGVTMIEMFHRLVTEEIKRIGLILK